MVIQIELIGSVNDKKTIFVEAKKANVVGGVFKLDGLTVREIVDKFQYNDYKIIDYCVYENGQIKSL